MPDGSDPQVKRGRKFDQVLEGARDVFMANGFEGASVDDIARAAGVSKATLYSYFPDKRLLFAEVAEVESKRQAAESLAEIDMNLPPADVLRMAARRLLAFLTSDFGRGVLSICAAESGRFPELGRKFYESGPELVRQHMANYFDSCRAQGTLKMEDPLMAADQFAELCKAWIFPRMLCGVQTEYSKTELDRVVDEAVKTFIARYGT